MQSASEALVSKCIDRRAKRDGDANEREKENEKLREEKVERFENLTNSELTAFVQTAPALRRPADVARATNWFRRKADTLRKLKLACGRTEISTAFDTVIVQYNSSFTDSPLFTLLFRISELYSCKTQ